MLAISTWEAAYNATRAWLALEGGAETDTDASLVRWKAFDGTNQVDRLSGSASSYLTTVEAGTRTDAWNSSFARVRTHFSLLTRNKVGFSGSRSDKATWRHRNVEARRSENDAAAHLLAFMHMKLEDCPLPECVVLRAFTPLAFGAVADGVEWLREVSLRDGREVEEPVMVSHNGERIPPYETVGLVISVLASYPELTANSGWPIFAYAAAFLAGIPGLLDGAVHVSDIIGDDAGEDGYHECVHFLSKVPTNLHSGYDALGEGLAVLSLEFLLLEVAQNKVCSVAKMVATAAASTKHAQLLPVAFELLVRNGWTWAEATYVTFVLLDRAMLPTEITLATSTLPCSRSTEPDAGARPNFCQQQAMTPPAEPLRMHVLQYREETSDMVRVFHDVTCVSGTEVIFSAAGGILQTKASIHIMDIGAAFGQCLFPVRWWYGSDRVRLTAVEPSARLRRLIRRNFASNGGLKGTSIVAGWVVSENTGVEELRTQYSNLAAPRLASMPPTADVPHILEHGSYKPMLLGELLATWVDVLIICDVVPGFREIIVEDYNTATERPSGAEEPVGDRVVCEARHSKNVYTGCIASSRRSKNTW
eukprot:TRINITY_DN122396_c0_g1_i1.p1 TRINITY_DN122396_c0_g1~~TRINITY_DN122396_c0_g1_i1.p1  ORF type:complete len:591 (+),score=44.76 TRINITY_DN122396_c0_g1_i1:172-1944(+)